MGSYTTQEALVIKAAEKLMHETMARYDVSHDRFHVERVRTTALLLAKESSSTSDRPIDFFVVELAALLHDVLDKKYVSAALAADPFAFFLPFYQSMEKEYGVDLINNGRGLLITEIIDNVSWSTEKKLRKAGRLTEFHTTCVELHCVQDADRLDAIGAFGIMRCAAYCAATNAPLHTPVQDNARGVSGIQHFHDKLLHIHEHLKTASGKLMGEKRHETLLNFLQDVKEEYSLGVKL